MPKVALALVASFALLVSAGCVGKAPVPPPPPPQPVTFAPPPPPPAPPPPAVGPVRTRG